ncbi:MAG: CHAT domain-containing protein [Zoogloea sp.]|nr:CHAT domain-containing protein [Zoogloea sp.]
MTFPIKVLFLAANGVDAQRLRLDEEARDIEEKISRVDRQAVALVTKGAVRAEDLQRLLNEHRPDILHFSGHGAEDEAIDFVSNGSRSAPVFADAFSQVLSASPAPIRVVVLNACYSDSLAKTLLPRIPVLIGMRTQIGDPAALAFSCGFYGALASRLPVQKAFEQGCAEIAVRNLNEAETPVLHHQDGIDPAGMLFSRKDGKREQATASSNQYKTVTAPSETQASFEARIRAEIQLELERTLPLGLGAALLQDGRTDKIPFGVALGKWWEERGAVERIERLTEIAEGLLDRSTANDASALAALATRVMALMALSGVDRGRAQQVAAGSSAEAPIDLRYITTVELYIKCRDEKLKPEFRRHGSAVAGAGDLGLSVLPENGWDEVNAAQDVVKGLWRLDRPDDPHRDLDATDISKLNYRLKRQQRYLTVDRSTAKLQGHPFMSPVVCSEFSALLPDVPVVHFGLISGAPGQSPLLVSESELVGAIELFMEMVSKHG